MWNKNKFFLHLGRTQFTERTPSLWLSPNTSRLFPRLSITSDSDVGLPKPGYTADNFLLNQWYHIAYTVSDPEKRMDLYVNSKWIAFVNVPLVQSQSVIFNDAPLYIGYDTFDYAVTGQIRYIY